jgi:hypothetical protein
MTDLRPSARLRLVSFKAVPKGPLRGFCTVELPPGLILSDLPVMIGNAGLWVALPGKPVLDETGRHKRDVNGKPEYQPMADGPRASSAIGSARA